MEQIKIDFLVTGSMSSILGEVQALNKGLMQNAGAINLLDKSMAGMGANMAKANTAFAKSVGMTGQWDHSMTSLTGSTVKFGEALQANTLSGSRYFDLIKKNARGASEEVKQLANQQVRLKNSVFMPGTRSSSGQQMAHMITPTGVGAAQMRELSNTQLAIRNKLLKDGSVAMTNWGKNTQWAGRQLMVGFTLPLVVAGGLAAKTFKDFDEQLVRLQKVYGSKLLFGEAFHKQSMMVRQDAIDMSNELANAYGQAGKDTAALMADLAAAGYEGIDLQTMTRESTRLATLGEMQVSAASTAVVALKSAFKIPEAELAGTVDFMNAVENQTSLSLEDLTGAIPRAGAVIRSLGGDVEDLATLMASMKEGGISAAEGANALKSGLSSIIAPPQAAVEFLKTLKIDLPKLVLNNQGDLMGTVLALQEKLAQLTDLQRQQAITKLFGKYQFARMTALFDNLGVKGTQSAKVMQLGKMSDQERAAIAAQELATKMTSISMQWDVAWQSMLMAITPIGSKFLSFGTTVLKGITSVMHFIDQLPAGIKTILGWGVGFVAALGPVIMLLGLAGNAIGMLVKGISNLIRYALKLKGVKVFENWTKEMVAAEVHIDETSTKVYNQAEAMRILRAEVEKLGVAYQGMNASAAEMAAGVFPGGATRALTEEEQKLLGRGQRTGSTGGQYSGDVPLNASHFVPMNPGSQADRDLLNSVFGYNPAAGLQYDFGDQKGAYTSALANKDANNIIPFFAGTKTNATEKQTLAAADLDNYINVQRKILQKRNEMADEILVTEEQILQWEMKTRAAAQRVAELKTQTGNEAERVYLEAHRDVVMLANPSFMEDQPVQSRDTKFSGPVKTPGFYRGMEDSWMREDMVKFMAAQQNVISATEGVTLAEQQMKKAIDGAIYAVDNEAVTIELSDIERKKAVQAQAKLVQETLGQAASFQITQIEGKKYLTALSASGEVLATASISDKKNAAARIVANEEILASIAQELRARQTLVMSLTEEAAAEQLAADRAFLASRGLSPNGLTPLAPTKPGFLEAAGSRYKSAGWMKSGGAIGAATMLPMITSSMFPTDSVGQDVSQGAMMGGMAGMMIGPEGAVGGAVIGGALAGLKNVFDHFKEQNDKMAAAAAAKWELEFNTIDLTQAMADSLKLGKLDSFRPPSVDLSGVGMAIPDATAEYASAVTAGFETQINQLKMVSDTATITDFGKSLYLNLVSSGVAAEKALPVISEIFAQADKLSNFADVSIAIKGITTEKQAEDALLKDLDRIGKKGSRVLQDAINSVNPNPIGRGGGMMGPVQDKGVQQAATTIGGSTADKIQQAFDNHSLNPKKYFSRFIQGGEQVGKSVLKSFDIASADANTAAMKLYSEQTGLAGSTVKELQASYLALDDAGRADFQDKLNQTQFTGIEGGVETFNTLTSALTLSGLASDEFTRKLFDSNNTIKGAAMRLLELGEASSLADARIRALTAAETAQQAAMRNQAGQSAFVSSALTMIDDPKAPVNLDKMANQQQRAMDNMQSAEDDRIAGMQDAADKREAIMQREIDQTNKQYDNEIAKLQGAEEARQKAFDRQQELAQRKAGLQASEISYKEAIANGDLFEAARIRADINAVRNQQQAADKNARKADAAAAAQAKLEKERTKKVGGMEKALEREQNMNEKVIQSAQDASDAKIAAAEKANAGILRDQKKANVDLEAAQKASTEELIKVWALYYTGHARQAKNAGIKLGLTVEEQAKLLGKGMTGIYGKLPNDILGAISSAIIGGKWGRLNNLMNSAMANGTPAQLEDIMFPGKKAPVIPGVSMGNQNPSNFASGGHVMGKGTGTSDSIPAMLSRGEYVIKASTVAKHGKSFFDRINVGEPSPSGHGLGFAKGGHVGMGDAIKGGLVNMAAHGFARIYKKFTGGVKGGQADMFNMPKGIKSGRIVMWDGEPVDTLTSAQLKVAGRLLGERYHVMQGSFQKASALSGTTHTDGGVVDVSPAVGVYDKSVIDMQRAGFAAWYRGPGAPGSAANYDPHIHAVSLFSKNLDTNAAFQRDKYLTMTGDGIDGDYYGPHATPIHGLRGSLPGLRRGASFVKYDNTIANLHRGESVLTAPMTQNLKENVARGGETEYNFNVVVNNPSSDVDIERALNRVMDTHERKMGRNRVIK